MGTRVPISRLIMFTCYHGIGYELLFIHLQSKELRIKLTQPGQSHLFNFLFEFSFHREVTGDFLNWHLKKWQCSEVP